MYIYTQYGFANRRNSQRLRAICKFCRGQDCHLESKTSIRRRMSAWQNDLDCESLLQDSKKKMKLYDLSGSSVSIHVNSSNVFPCCPMKTRCTHFSDQPNLHPEFQISVNQHVFKTTSCGKL